MAVRVVISKKTKEVFTFKDEWNTASGLVKKLQYEVQPGAKAHKHYHPDTKQTFEVLEGELAVVVDGVKSVLKKGDFIKTKLGSVHSQRNASSYKAVVIEGYEPAILGQLLKVI